MKTWISVLCHCFIGPIRNASEIIDILISDFHQLIGCLSAADAGTAINQKDRIQIRKFLWLCIPDSFIGDQDAARDVPCRIFVFPAHINHGNAALIHHCFGLAGRDFMIGAFALRGLSIHAFLCGRVIHAAL